MKIDGEKISFEIIEKLKQIKTPKKFLGVFLVGENQRTFNFIKQKEKVAEILGVDFRIYQKNENIKNDELRKAILQVALKKTCGGVILQLPLPYHLNSRYVANVIPREKDVDVLGERALGAFYNQRNLVLPPAVAVVEELIKRLDLDLKQQRVLILGRGLLIGRPVGLWLFDKVKELLIIDELKHDNLDILRHFDIIISGVGKANLFNETFLKQNSVVIDFGYDFKDGKILGDFDNQVSREDIIFTPTPKGTGPILVSKIFENFYKLNQE